MTTWMIPADERVKTPVVSAATVTLERPTPALELAGGYVEPLVDPISSTGSSLPCHVRDPEIWFAETPSGVEEAKALCGSCPIRAACLAGALDRREPWGVWGGELFASGVVVARKRPRGRPRKSDAA